MTGWASNLIGVLGVLMLLWVLVIAIAPDRWRSAVMRAWWIIMATTVALIVLQLLHDHATHQL